MYNGYKVNHVINITDVGHLTSDADAGEDKMIKGLKREGLPVTKDSMLKLAQIYTDQFMEDFDSLNILPPKKWTKATAYVQQMIEMIQKIVKNGYAYETSTAVYFDISTFDHYGELAKLDIEELKAGARVKVDPEKKNPHDFVLWFKAVEKHKNHLMQWDSPWGKGFPGWHIECSAMACYHLGEQFDIHTGGIDHIPVHHTNEIAQTEAATNKHPWVKYWMHGEFLVLDKEKMSKSKGMFLTLQTITDKGYDPLVYRYFCLTAHYRKQLTFSYEGLDAAQNALHKLQNKVLELLEKPEEGEKTPDQYISDFHVAINDDLNMPQALAVVWDMLKNEDVNNDAKYDTLMGFDKVFGLRLNEIEKVEVSREVQELLTQREHARLNKHWNDADALRDKIHKLGYILDDSPTGTVVKKA